MQEIYIYLYSKQKQEICEHVAQMHEIPVSLKVTGIEPKQILDKISRKQ